MQHSVIFLTIAIAIATMALAPTANMSFAQNTSAGGSASATGGAGGNGGTSATTAQGGNGGSASAVGTGSGLASGSGTGVGVGSSTAVGGAGGNGGTCTAVGCPANGGNGGSASAGASGSGSTSVLGSTTTGTGTGTGTGTTTTGTGTTTTTTTSTGGHIFNHFGGHFFGLRHFNFGSGAFIRETFNNALLSQYVENSGVSSSQVVILSETPGQILLTSGGSGTLTNPCPDSAPVFLSNGLCAAFQTVQSEGLTVVQPAPVQQEQAQQTVVVQAPPAPTFAPQCLSADQVQALVNQINTLQAQLNAKDPGTYQQFSGFFNHFHGQFHPGTH